MISWNLDLQRGVSEKVRAAANRGLALSGEHVLAESNKRVPIEEHTLEESGTVSTDPRKNRVAVSYDTPYSVRQHEDMAARHDEGRTAKYLENALTSSVPAVQQIMVKAIKGVL